MLKKNTDKYKTTIECLLVLQYCVTLPIAEYKRKFTHN